MRGLAGLLALSVILFVVAPVALSQDTSEVRIVHLSPDTSPVDIWADGAKIKEYVGFQRSTEYLQLSSGDHQIEIRPWREINVLASLSISLIADGRYTIAITGLSGQSDLQLVSLWDDRVSVYLYSKVRFAHASPGLPAIDIAIAGGPVLVSNLEYRQFSDYIQVRPDVYTLEVRAAGTETVLYTIPNAGFSRSANCTIFTTIESEVAGVLETTHTFEHNGPLDHNQLILGLALWAALLAWFVHNHMRA